MTEEKKPPKGIAADGNRTPNRVRIVAYVSPYAKKILNDYARARNGSLGTAIEILAKEHAADDPLAARERDRDATEARRGSYAERMARLDDTETKDG